MGLRLKVVFLLAVECLGSGEDTQWSLGAQGLRTSSDGQGQRKLQQYLELLLFSTTEIFLSLFPYSQVFFLVEQ